MVTNNWLNSLHRLWKMVSQELSSDENRNIRTTRTVRCMLINFGSIRGYLQCKLSDDWDGMSWNASILISRLISVSMTILEMCNFMMCKMRNNLMIDCYNHSEECRRKQKHRFLLKSIHKQQRKDFEVYLTFPTTEWRHNRKLLCLHFELITIYIYLCLHFTPRYRSW
jgi:hypothetical protein